MQARPPSSRFVPFFKQRRLLVWHSHTRKIFARSSALLADHNHQFHAVSTTPLRDLNFAAIIFSPRLVNGKFCVEHLSPTTTARKASLGDQVPFWLYRHHFTLARFFGNGTADSTHINIRRGVYNALRISAHCFNVVISIDRTLGSTPGEIIAISKRTFTVQTPVLPQKTP